MFGIDTDKTNPLAVSAGLDDTLVVCDGVVDRCPIRLRPFVILTDNAFVDKGCLFAPVDCFFNLMSDNNEVITQLNLADLVSQEYQSSFTCEGDCSISCSPIPPA